MKLNWGQSIFLFFVIFISLGIAFIIFSLRQNNDLVTDNYYEQGADYTHQMEMNSRSAVFIDSIQLINHHGSSVARLSKSIHQMTDTLQLSFFRPSDKRFDSEMVIVLRSDSFIIDKSGLVKGRYQLKFQWRFNQEKYQVVKDYFVD